VFFLIVQPRVTPKRVDWNSQPSFTAVNPKQCIFDNAVLMESLNNANNIPRSENYIFNFNHT